MVKVGLLFPESPMTGWNVSRRFTNRLLALTNDNVVISRADVWDLNLDLAVSNVETLGKGII